MLLICVVILGGCASSRQPAKEPLQRYEFSAPHMGTTFQILLYAPSDSIANRAARQSFAKVEKLNSIFSDYKSNSELNELTGQSGWVPVSAPLYNILKRSVQISRATSGAFDVTVGPYVKLWRNLANQYKPQLPSPDTLKALRKRVGYQKIMFDESQQAIKLRAKNMQLDLGGIAKGYTADKVLKVLQRHGIQSALVNAGGDIATGDAPPAQSGWTIAIPCYITPNTRGMMQFTIANKAIASSGDMFQHISIDGTRYSHIVDPRTGLGVTNHSTTTVVAPNGITADAYASAFNVMPPSAAIALAKSNSKLQLNITYLHSDSISRKATSFFKQLRCKD